MKLKSFPWNCLFCTLKHFHSVFPFSLSNEDELKKINSCNSMKFIESLPKINITEESSRFAQVNLSSIDENMPSLLSTKYYSVDELKKSNITNNVNIFLSNVNSLEAKHENLLSFLTDSPKFDLIGITETSEKSETSFISNVDIDGYKMFHTPTDSSKGGSLMYVDI